MQDNVHRTVKVRQAMPDSRPHPAANPVAFHSAAKQLSHGKSNSRAGLISTLEKKCNHVT